GGITRRAPTPRVDQLASEGLRLTNFNVEAECTPTRAALMTGRMPLRTGCQHATPPGFPFGLAPWEHTLPRLLSEAGYRTAIYGKWHLGKGPDRHPTAMGFDEWYGIQDSTAPAMHSSLVGFEDWMETPKIWESQAGAPAEVVAEYDLDNRPLIDAWITERACAYLEARGRDHDPFFLYVPFTQVHHPAIPHPDFEGASGNTAFADSMIEADHRTGQILDAIDAAGLRDDTIVVWASDNGPILVPSMGPQADSGPFRGFLGSAYEGQLRVPCVIRWPGVIEPGRASDDIVSILDFYATFAALAGGQVPEDRAIDSLDLSAFLRGDEPSPRDHVICFIGDTLAAVKWKQFKIHFIEYGNEPGRRTKTELGHPQLYNVAADPKEQWDIMEPNTWIAQAMARLLIDYTVSVEQFPHVPTGGHRPAESSTVGKLTSRG
ncbi:MAG: sulfatase-like hydrolase/transferase, partial [Microthrixaceae bacterium]